MNTLLKILFRSLKSMSDVILFAGAAVSVSGSFGATLSQSGQPVPGTRRRSGQAHTHWGRWSSRLCRHDLAARRWHRPCGSRIARCRLAKRFNYSFHLRQRSRHIWPSFEPWQQSPTERSRWLDKIFAFCLRVVWLFTFFQLKESPWEGGVRGVAAVWSPLLNKTQRVSNQLMHVSDWLPTFYSAAGRQI